MSKFSFQQIKCMARTYGFTPECLPQLDICLLRFCDLHAVDFDKDEVVELFGLHQAPETRGMLITEPSELWRSLVSPGRDLDSYSLSTCFQILQAHAFVSWKGDQQSYAMNRLVHAWAYERLGPENQADAARRRDPVWLPGIKYLMITAIEGCIDVAQHLCSSEGWGPPSDNGHAVRLLGRHGVLEQPLADRLGQAVGFREVLVHEHVDVDDAIVVERLGDLSDLTEFLRAVAVWLSRT